MTTGNPSGFSSSDIETSLEKLILSSIRRPYDTLGTRRTDVSFNDVQEAAAGVFLLRASAPFYVAFLGVQRLLELVAAEDLLIGQLLEAVDATGRKVFPIKDLTPLANSTSALFELEAAVGQRSQGFKSIDQVPAFQRFQQNLNQFLQSAGANVKDQGQIVQTPQEARSNIPSLVTQIRDSHAELVRRATFLAAALDDYGKVNLPSLAAAGVISRARQLLQTHQQTLEGLSESARLSVIRPIVLDLLSAKAVVKQYGSFQAPNPYLTVVGTGTPYSDSTHLANPGNVTGNILGPWPIASGFSQLDLWLDAPTTPRINGNVDSITAVIIAGELFPFKAQFNRAAGSFSSDGVVVGDLIYVKSGPNTGERYVVTQVLVNSIQATGVDIVTLDAGPVSIEVWRTPSESIALGQSYLGVIESSVRENYFITVSNNQLSIFVNGVTVITTFPLGSQTAQTLANTINAAIAGAGQSAVATSEAFLSPLKYDGVVDLTVAATTGTFTLQAGQFDGLGLAIGDELQVLSGSLAGLTYVLTAVDLVAPLTFVQAITGAIPNESGLRVQIGPPGRKLRIKLLDPKNAIANRRTLKVDDDPLYAGAVLLLGFPSGAVFESRPTTGQELVKDYNSKAQKSHAAIIQQLVTSVTTGRTKPEDNTRVVLFRFRGTGDVTATPGTVVVAVAAGGLLAAGAQVGDSLVLRSGNNPDSVWTITVITDTSITATSGITTLTATGISIEVGPTLAITRGMLLSISTSANNGDYYVKASTSIPFEFQLEGVLPVYKDGFSSSVLFTATLSREAFNIASNNTTTSSLVTIAGEAAQLFNSSLPLTGHGTTPWFKLPNIPTELQTNDFLELYASNYTVPTTSILITSINKDLSIIGLQTPVDSLISWLFGDGSAPFARLRSGHVLDYSLLQGQLTTWGSQLANLPAFFIDLNRFLNPLLVTENPTDQQVGDARNKILGLLGLLSTAGAALASADPSLTLEAILKSYDVSVVPEVDTLLRSFTEKGSDRAVDLLTEGQFTTFFGLTVDGASYSGALQEAMRSVARADLPIRKENRDDAKASRQIGQIDDVDPEYNSDPNVDDVRPDPPSETPDRGS